MCVEGDVSTDSTDAIQSVRQHLRGYRHFLIALPDAYQCSPPHQKDERTLFSLAFVCVGFALIIFVPRSLSLSLFLVIDVFSWHPLAIHSHQ